MICYVFVYMSSVYIVSIYAFRLRPDDYSPLGYRPSPLPWGHFQYIFSFFYVYLYISCVYVSKDTYKKSLRRGIESIYL
jgi:hypothetical protein